MAIQHRIIDNANLHAACYVGTAEEMAEFSNIAVGSLWFDTANSVVNIKVNENLTGCWEPFTLATALAAHVASPTAHAVATDSSNGFLSQSDKEALQAILGVFYDGNNVLNATTTTSGAMSASDKTFVTNHDSSGTAHNSVSTNVTSILARINDGINNVVPAYKVEIAFPGSAISTLTGFYALTYYNNGHIPTRSGGFHYNNGWTDGAKVAAVFSIPITVGSGGTTVSIQPLQKNENVYFFLDGTVKASFTGVTTTPDTAVDVAISAGDYTASFLLYNSDNAYGIHMKDWFTSKVTVRNTNTYNHG